METTTPKPTIAKHHDHADGTVTVDYLVNGEVAFVREYSTSREASIESTLLMFPGTDRGFLERAHAEQDRYDAWRLPKVIRK